MSAIKSPFEAGRNVEVFDAMLKLRWANWTRIRRNRLARRRYKAKQQETRRAGRGGAFED